MAFASAGPASSKPLAMYVDMVVARWTMPLRATGRDLSNCWQTAPENIPYQKESGSFSFPIMNFRGVCWEKLRGCSWLVCEVTPAVWWSWLPPVLSLFFWSQVIQAKAFLTPDHCEVTNNPLKILKGFKRSLNHPKKVTLNHQEVVFFLVLGELTTYPSPGMILQVVSLNFGLIWVGKCDVYQGYQVTFLGSYTRLSYISGDSMWPFDSSVGSHLTFERFSELSYKKVTKNCQVYTIMNIYIYTYLLII